MKIINYLYRLSLFPLLMQLITLIVFVILIAGGLSANTSDMGFARVLRNTNFANLIVWSYWWPLIVLSAIFLGRVWCTVCPMELITSLAARFGLRRKPPTFFRSGWIITLFYILILFGGIHVFKIHRVPFRMAIYMIILFGTAVVTGLLFSRNAFCQHVCPVGHLLGLYARLAPLGWGVKDPDLCTNCKDKSCVSNKTAYEFQGRSCGVGLMPAKIQDNTQCLLCGHCLKACDRNNPGTEGRPNPRWLKRRWFQDLLTLKAFTPAQAFFCLIVSGFVIYEVFTEWSIAKQLLLFLPALLQQKLNFSSVLGKGLTVSLLLFFVLPAIIWLLPYILFRLAGGKIKFGDYILNFGIAFIPVMAAAHAVKAILKMKSRIPYWIYLKSDPTGKATADKILDGKIQLGDLPGWAENLITGFSILLMVGGIWLSLVIIRRLITRYLPDSGWRGLIFYLITAAYGSSFLVILLAWRVI
ncbi:MAG: 4Fe-4S binding protein [Myxococcota bacterium]